MSAVVSAVLGEISPFVSLLVSSVVTRGLRIA